MEVKMKTQKKKKLQLKKITIKNLSVLKKVEQKNIYAGGLGTTDVPYHC